jgi:uncharacterized protein (DUF1810 family)
VTDIPDSTADPYNLERFVRAQADVFERAGAELRGGQKQTHWMWFIFPQFQGLGRSEMARRFAISSLEEAEAYLRHGILEPRLIACTELVNQIQGRAIEEIFGWPDHLKFHSSMTLFSHATADNGVFRQALRKYFAEVPDPLTLKQLELTR